eukprot:COSAG04_NODE_17692_length_461_cov_1.588398_1_plen_114_part_00
MGSLSVACDSDDSIPVLVQRSEHTSYRYRYRTAAGCGEVVRQALRHEATAQMPALGRELREVEFGQVPAAAHCDDRVICLARDAACLPFGVVGELRRKLGPIAYVVLLLGMGV